MPNLSAGRVESGWHPSVSYTHLRYDMTFLGLHTFDRWGQICTTGIFEKDGREFVFVPGDTVTLGWEQFALGLNQESREELEYLFREWEMERDPEEMIRESMAPVRQVAIRCV